MSAAPAKESARVFAPLSAISQRAAANVGLYTAAGRRAVRKQAAVSAPLAWNGYEQFRHSLTSAWQQKPATPADDC